MKKCSQSVERIFNVIELVASQQGGMGISEISRNLEYPKSTVYRIASSLVAKKYFQKDPTNQKYMLNYRFIAIASDYVSKLDIRTVASPYINKLSRDLDCTVHIGIMRNQQVVYIEKIKPYMCACVYSEIGKTNELYCSGLGKALLIGMDEKTYTSYLNSYKYIKYTKTTLNNDELDKEMKIARKTNIAIDNAEHEEGVFCLATPIYNFNNDVIAAISISTSRKEILKEEKYKINLLECGKEISKIFGKTK